MLLLLDPWLALSVGFALSALATAGILFLGPPFRDALARWLPRWAAEALAVPFAAQLACTPVVAAISGQVSLVAVVANLVVAVVGRAATVLGLLGGVLVRLVAPAGLACGWLAGLCASWIITVATHLARLPDRRAGLGAGGGAGAGPRAALRGASVSVPARCSGASLVGGAQPGAGRGDAPAAAEPRAGRPGWVLVACDVGQGDGLVLNAGRGSGGGRRHRPGPAGHGRLPRPARRAAVAGVVLTHFHADHVDGLARCWTVAGSGRST